MSASVPFPHTGQRRSPCSSSCDMLGLLPDARRTQPAFVRGLRREGMRHEPARSQRGRPALAFPVAVLKKFGDDRASQLAALIAYYGFFSLFPLLLVFATVASF